VPARICVAIRETTTERALESARRAAAWADLVEIRADFVRDLDLKRLLVDKPCPVLLTLRSRSEGGEYQGTELSRLEILLEGAGLGADWIDVEHSAFWKGVLDSVDPRRVIVSHHDLEKTPPSLDALADEMAASGAAVLKIATKANRLTDNLVIAEVLRHAARHGMNLCALAMGRAGVPSRVLGPSWGSWMTFASLPGGEPTADGQLPADQLADLFRVRRIGLDTRLYGVLGRPLTHSLSPRLHNAVFAAQDRDAVYLPLEASDVEDFLRFCEAVPLRGASVTIPYKEEAYARSASLSVEADRTGAVNTLLRREGLWHGENTDIEGFLRPLRRRTHVASLRAVVLGAGGAARAVVCALTSSGASVCVAARDAAKGQHLARRFAADHVSWSQLKGLSWDLLVNTTPVGMHPESDASPVPAEWLTGKWVYDLVYNPRETRLLQDAAKKGCRVIGGSEMFLAQAVKQQMLWFETQPPEDVMQAALDEALPPISAAAPEKR